MVATGQEEQTGQVGWKLVPDAEDSADVAAAGVVASGGAAAGRQAAGLPTAVAAAAMKKNPNATNNKVCNEGCKAANINFTFPFHLCY